MLWTWGLAWWFVVGIWYMIVGLVRSFIYSPLERCWDFRCFVPGTDPGSVVWGTRTWLLLSNSLQAVGLSRFVYLWLQIEINAMRRGAGLPDGRMRQARNSRGSEGVLRYGECVLVAWVRGKEGGSGEPLAGRGRELLYQRPSGKGAEIWMYITIGLFS